MTSHSRISLAYFLMIFLNAFIDVGHKIIIINIFYQTLSVHAFTIYSALANAFILIPYILFVLFAGFISDRYPKAIVIRITAFIAIPAAMIIVYCYYYGHLWLGFFMILLLGTQSAFNAPAKYGYIKEYYGKKAIARINAYVQMLVTSSILSSTFFFTFLFHHLIANSSSNHFSALLYAIWPLGLILLGLAIIEALLSLRLPIIAAGNSESRFELKKILQGQDFKLITYNRTILASILSLALFWGIAQFIVNTYPSYMKQYLHASALIAQLPFSISIIGIILGSVVAGKLSKDHIETALLPFCPSLLALLLIIMASFTHLAIILIASLLFGLISGLLIIPLNALMQFNAPKTHLGKILSQNNFIQNIAMLSFLLLTICATSINIDARVLFYCNALIMFSSTLIYFFLIPQSLLRIIVFCKDKIRFALCVKGMDCIPSASAAIILCPTQSPQDWAYLQSACPRKIHFIALEENSIANIPNWYRKTSLIPDIHKSKEAYQQYLSHHPKDVVAIINKHPQETLRKIIDHQNQATLIDARIKIAAADKRKKQITITFVEKDA